MSRRRRGGERPVPPGESSAGDPTPVERGVQRGTQAHAEGQHGPRTQARLLEQLRQGQPCESREARIARERQGAAYQGKRRLVEPREQHDEAELRSERTQLARAYRHGELGDGPADNSTRLHGVLGHKGHRADYKRRHPDGLRVGRDRRED